ncbi:MAG: hypothetical protein ABL916_22940 [Burkholderiaceae bacterium]
MINLPSDTLPKLLTFLGIAIVGPCAVEHYQLIQRLQTANVVFASSAAEEKALWDQKLAALQEATKRTGEAADAYARSTALLKQGLASQAAVQSSIGDSLSVEARANKLRSEAAQARADQKSVEVARNMAFATSLARTVSSESIGLLIGMASGVAIFCIGLVQWGRAEQKPSPFRRVTRKRGQ